jgi:predicted TIM-barrel fold metal-dependent hydrolase
MHRIQILIESTTTCPERPRSREPHRPRTDIPLGVCARRAAFIAASVVLLISVSYVREIGSLLQKPNVYLDISGQDLLMTPRTESSWLREWLEFEPEKVLFGSDGYPYSSELGWAESTWIASHNARQALGVALTRKLRDGDVSLDRANEIARLVLRGNAEDLYFPPASP